MFAKEVEGRVCTEIDARLANNASEMIAAGQLLNSLYNELGVKTDKLIFRLPGVRDRCRHSITSISSSLLLLPVPPPVADLGRHPGSQSIGGQGHFNSSLPCVQHGAGHRCGSGRGQRRSAQRRPRPRVVSVDDYIEHLSSQSCGR